MDHEFIHESQDIVIGSDCGRFVVSVKVEAGSNDFVTLPIAVQNYGAISTALIRHKYSENEVEAIVSNYLMLMQNPSSVSEEESNEKLNEFNVFQEYREKCKARAKELLSIGEEMGIKEMQPCVLYDKKYIKSKQARLDWSCLLATYQYIDKSSCFASNDMQRDIPVQALPFSKV